MRLAGSWEDNWDTDIFDRLDPREEYNREQEEIERFELETLADE